MKTPNLKVLAALGLLGLCGTVFGASLPNIGTVNITVLDEKGQPVQDAPVYIYGEYKTRFVGGNQISGSTTFEMREGDYRISSALVQRNSGYTDRFASNEAHVRVVAGDNVAVILTLKPIQDVEPSLAYADLRRMGVAADVARLTGSPNAN